LERLRKSVCGNTIGTVEEIGLRATRIRTLDNTVVSVPNAEFSRQHLENYTWREKTWFHPKISLPYETPREKIAQIASDVAEMLKNHPEVLDDPILQAIGANTKKLPMN
jgi:MscS family membrane protein